MPKASFDPGTKWNKNIDPDHARRAVRDYLATLDDPAYGAASDVTPKFVSPSDPPLNGRARFAMRLSLPTPITN
jgi:hypothetical protein